MDLDQICEIVDDLWLTRDDVSATALRLKIGEVEVAAALAFAPMHGGELFLAQANRRRRGAVSRLRPLDETKNPSGSAGA